MTVTIRQIDESLLADYKAIRLEALQKAPDAFGGSYDEEATQDDGFHQLRLQAGQMYGAYVQGQIVGMAGVVLYGERKLAHRAAIWGIYVSPAQRGQQIGKKLVAAALENMPPQVKRVALSVATENEAAIKIYKEMGFEKYSLEKMAWIDDGRVYDEYLMVKFL